MHSALELAEQLLPERMKMLVRKLSPAERESAEELRLRTGLQLSVLLHGREKGLGGVGVEPEELAYVLDRASRSSIHSVQRELREGFLTAEGGLRIGVCGSFGGDGMRDFSSLAIRLPHEKRGIAAEVMSALAPFDKSVLILSPPGVGKTTFLRELIRVASEKGRRVSICDERWEIAAMWRGRPSFDLGPCADVLSGFGKGEGVTMLLRAMNPEIIALDEISAASDREAMEQAACCGAHIFATAHAAALEELHRRSYYREMLQSGIFDCAVVISNNGGRRYKLVDIC